MIATFVVDILAHPYTLAVSNFCPVGHTLILHVDNMNKNTLCRYS